MTRSQENRIETFTWDALPELLDLLISLGPHGFRTWPESVPELQSELESMRLTPESDIALLRSSGELCGYAAAISEQDIGRTVASVATAQDCASAAGLLLDFVENRARSTGVSRVHIAMQGTGVEPLGILSEFGFGSVTANLQLVLEREDAGDHADAPLPAGYTMRPMRSSAEVLLLTQVQNAVFEDHWGFSKNTPDEIQARLNLPSTGPEHVLFAESPDGEIAGYVWTALEWHEGQTCGKIWMTGVTPGFRGKRLGKAVVTAGIRHLLAEGAADVHLEVVEHNAPAVRIYEAVGFKLENKTDWYEKVV